MSNAIEKAKRTRRELKAKRRHIEELAFYSPTEWKFRKMKQLSEQIDTINADIKEMKRIAVGPENIIGAF